MKSPLNASSSPPSAPRDIDTAGQLSELYSHITTLKDQLALVHAAIERLEQSIGIRDPNCTSRASNQSLSQHPQSGSAIPTNLPPIQGASPRRYQSVNRNNLEGPPVAISPRFGTLAPPPSPCSPSVNASQSRDRLATTFHTASPPAYLNVPSFKTPQQVVSDLASISDIGTFYIVTKGREPGIYTDWPKAEALVRGLKHSVYCKKYDKRDAIQVYTDAYEENRLEPVFK